MIWSADPPADIVIERKVDQAIANGHRVPRWGWPVPCPYNGATGPERIAGWQKTIVAQSLGFLPPLTDCTACEVRKAEQRHNEIYARSLAAMPVCRSCHARIHRRYGSPDTWHAFLRESIPATSWLRGLAMQPISRADGFRLAEQPDLLKAVASYSAALRADQLP